MPFLERLVLHGWRETGWLFEHRLRHEVFRLIQTALSAAAINVADGLVADVVAGPDIGADAELSAYTRFNALTWMTQYAPNLRSAQRALDQVRADHPDFAVRPYPDLTSSWSVSDPILPQRPMTAVQLHERIATDATAVLAELLRYKDSTGRDGPTWHGALAVLVDAVRDQPADGLAMLNSGGCDHSEILRALIRAWAAAQLDEVTAELILTALAQVNLDVVAEDIVRLLSDGGQDEANPTEWHRFSSARRLAAVLWTTLGGNDTNLDGLGWLSRAINHPAGRLALFWMHAIAADWRDAGNSWLGLPPEIRTKLELLLVGDDNRSALAEVVFASQIHFLFGADHAWCESQVLPLLDWDNPARASRTWDGFLTWGRWNDRLLSAGLLKYYAAAAGHINELQEERRRQLYSHLAGVAVFSELDLLQWMRTLTVALNVDDRAHWMSNVAWKLEKLSAEAIEHKWQSRMQQYWQDRIDSIPIQLTVQEASAMASWVVHLTDSIEAGVTLATAHPAAVNEHSDLLRDLDHERLNRAPVAFAQLLKHLLRGTSRPFWGGHFLAKIVPQLRAHPGVDVRAIVQEALRLGCDNAPEW